jgi:leader peptidase (prepilin peptidase)/N-methyltransferase
MLAILSFIYGASIGSFVQVVASRLHVAPILKGRSKCLSCGETLHASDLIPVFSYVFLGGKCRYCKSTYGVSALVIELLYGFSFFLVYKLIVADLGLSLEALLWLVYYTLLFIVLGVMALYDKAHSYIPSKFLMAFLALCGVIFVRRIMEDQDITTWLSPFFVALPFLSIWLISKGKGLRAIQKS